MRARYIRAAAWIGFLLLLRCSLDPLAGGSDNPDFKVVGIVTHANGDPAGNTRVMLFPASYNTLADQRPADSSIDTTNEYGEYLIHAPRSGSYTILGVHLEQRTRLLVSGVTVGGTITTVSRASLKGTGALKVSLPQDVDSAEGYVFIPGTDLFTLLGGRKDYVILDSVPAGAVPALYYATKNQPGVRILKHNIALTPGDTLPVAFPEWRHSTSVYINTTASGAAINEDVTNFPAVVRLTKDNFPFNEAKDSGEDIRFAKTDGTPLKSSVSRWDAASGEAEIWVHVDTIFGNDSSHAIVMHWGNAAAGAGSTPAAVFDTARGFAGVWHLEEIPLPGTGSLLDQTGSGCHGTPWAGMNAGNSVTGIAGRAVDFDGVDDCIRVRRPVQDDFTISFWMKADGDSRQWQPVDRWWRGDGLVDGDLAGSIASDTSGDFGITYINNRLAFGGSNTDNTLVAEKAVNDRAWHYITVTRKKSTGAKAIYIDGNEAAAVSSGATFPYSEPDSLSFGKLYSGGNAFDGKLDEIHISGAVRTSAWIKLCYMNQKPQDALFEFIK
jgi:hypothetical protein